MVQAVDVTKFITASDASSEAFKTATLLKTLNVNALIIGETGVGKKSLAKFILPNAPVVDASQYQELLVVLDSNDAIVIANIDNSPNLKILLTKIVETKTRVIATSKQSLKDESLNELFSVQFDIPPLHKREKDIPLLIQKFSSEASTLFGGEETIDYKAITPDLSLNASSLRRQVMIRYLLENIQDKELMDIIQNYIAPKLGSNNDYKEFLYLYETPLIKAGLEKFKSQLQLADRLGLNRNTLRKKIADNKNYL